MEDIKIKLEPQDEVPDRASRILSACDTLKILDEGSQMITVPIRDRLRSEDERLFIDSLGFDQQIFASEDNQNPKDCDICQYRFRSQQDISSHRVHHEMNLHFCRLGCGIWLDTLEKILEHEYRQHTQPGHAFCCRVCDFLANSADDLASHMQRHIYVYRFVCSVCRRHFESKQSLNLHRKQSQNFCRQLDFKKGLSSKPELVAVTTPVPSESFCYVQIKEEPLNAEEADQMILEDSPPLNVKLEPQDEEMPDPIY
ncbi:telomere zinc finger-associated protein isoform X2 [Drosophila sechellia]|uniref:telomere zinc finger-associated protein isoform X2 n=1 Tax=Drosophila sechellia TaxID=7238 RepID=UPI0013DE1411|nr:telomere zinc finger-associated protein isoform X2 [Drosophila sechellia]